MSIFKSQGIILKIKKLEEKNNLYTILTSDYGKILCNKKLNSREKTLDLGYFINFEIEVKSGVNIFNIRNIKIISQFDSLGQKYSVIENFMILLNIIHLKLPEKLANIEIFNNLVNIVKYTHPQPLPCKEGRKLTSTKLILAQLKILNILGLLDLEHKNLTIKKILHFINKNKMENILKLTGIDEELENQLKNIVQQY